MKIGGVQKSLCNLLWTIKDQYDVTLYLFDDSGSYELPPNVKVQRCEGAFRYFGISHGQCKGMEKYKRGVLRLICRLFSRPTAVRLMLLGQRKLKTQYDCAIAYLQNGNIHNLYGGVQDFVLHCVKATKKVAFLHCDYEKSGANEPRNNRLYEKFDAVAACSDGCRRSFEKTLPQYGEKCRTVRNCHRFDEIRRLSVKESVEYSENRRNVLMVTRLAHEKGIERALAAVKCVKERGIDISLHIVGSGAMQAQMHALARDLKIEDAVIFYGEQSNPYRFMPNAELLLMTSFYEAAPMVIEEALSLGLPVLTTQTTSAQEMIGQNGWICENSQEAINDALYRVLKNREELKAMRKKLIEKTADNDLAVGQFETLLEN